MSRCAIHHQPFRSSHALQPICRIKGRLHNVVCHTIADRVASGVPDFRSLAQRFDADGDGRLTFAEAQQAFEAWQVDKLSSDKAIPCRNDVPSPSVTPAITTAAVSQPSTTPKAPGSVTWELQILNGIRAANARGQSPATALMAFMSRKLQNTGASRAPASDLLWSFCGMFVAVLALGVINMYVRTWPVVGEWHQQGLGLLLGSFGTLCVLIFGRPEAEAVRIWNLLAGHVVATATVITLLHVLGPSIYSRALAMACMIAMMLATDSVHPPGGALVLMAVDSAAIQRMDWWFMLYPSLAFTIAVLLPLGVAVNWLKRNIKFEFSTEPSAPSFNASVPELKPKAA